MLSQLQWPCHTFTNHTPRGDTRTCGHPNTRLRANIEHAIRGPEGYGDTNKPEAGSVSQLQWPCHTFTNHTPRGDARTHGHPNNRFNPCCIATPLGKRIATRHPVLSKRLQRTQCRHNTPAEQHSHTPSVRLLRTDAPQSTNRIGSGAKHVHRCHPTISNAPTLTVCRTTVAHGPTATWKRQTEGQHRACN